MSNDDPVLFVHVEYDPYLVLLIHLLLLRLHLHLLLLLGLHLHLLLLLGLHLHLLWLLGLHMHLLLLLLRVAILLPNKLPAVSLTITARLLNPLLL